MNDVVDARYAKLVNVKNRSVVVQFKDDVGLVLIYNDAQIEKIIGIAVGGMDHEVGTHLVQCQHHFADLQIKNKVGLHGITNEIAKTLQVLNAASNSISVVH